MKNNFCLECEAYLDDDGFCGECEYDHDIVHQPDHYARFKIEPITFIMKNELEFWRGNIIKYGARAGYKIYDGKTQEDSEITDLEKIKRYCDMRINQINGKDTL
jgi:hypothetical protein